MTSPALPHPEAPPVRSVRQWLIALAQTVVCVVLGVLIWLVALGLLLDEFRYRPPVELVTLSSVDAVLGATVSLAIGPLRFLRPGRLDVAVHLVIAAVAGLSVWAVPAGVIALYRVGLRRRLPLDVAGIGLTVAVTCLALFVDVQIRRAPVDLSVGATAVVMLVGATVPVLIGHIIATRRELVATLREKAEVAERERQAAERARVIAQRERRTAEREAAALLREREADTARVRAEERAALARDVHDSISHHLAMIAMHAGALTYREDMPPAEIRRVAGIVRDGAQEANRELRGVLRSLRTSAGDAPLATVPTLTELVEDRRAGGQDVRLDWEDLTPEELATRDRATVVALARILAEATANAAKHSPGTPLRVRLSREDDRLVLRARNPLVADDPREVTSTGHGLVGVQERARLLGGDARRVRTADSFELEAWVPW
ncbi:histidine kinase [Brachybacterium sp. J144]|uniref:sensor histidine kinase n=1 Tax=Brachybacterium sp. J144 TaxID=3116487 RepID=UPI002E79DD42|nr:histidine kinase [Brachybacterium sp. J144]MEE1650122.1 histidine kinase [Brachybacterium sp. J144]